MRTVEAIEAELLSCQEQHSKRVDLLNELAFCIKTTDTARALECAREAVALSETIAYHKGLGEAFIMCALCHWYTSQYKKALEEAYTALHILEQVQDIEGQSKALNTIGIINRNLGDYSKALSHHNQALKLDILSGNKKHQTQSLHNIGVIYKRLADHAKAIEFLGQSLSISEEQSDNQAEAMNLSSIGNLHYDLCDYHQSVRYHQRSLSIYESLKDKWGEADSLQNLGLVAAKMGDMDDALVFHRRSLSLRQEIKDKMGEANSFFYIGEIFNQQSNDVQAVNFYKHSLALRQEIKDLYGEAEAYLGYGTVYLNPDSTVHNTILAIEQFNKSLRIATDLQARQIVYRAHELLSQAYKQIHFHQKALEHFEKFYSVRLEVGGDHVANRVKQLEVRLATEKSEGKAEIHRLKNVELAGALEKVAALNENLIQLDKEKNEFLSIVSHDLKNPIAAILLGASTLERYYERMSPDDVLKHIRQIGSTATRMNDIVHKLLDVDAIESGKMSLKIEDVNLSLMLDHVIKEYKTRALAKSIKIGFDTSGADCFIRADANSLRECVENLFSNAVKYSPLGKRITVRILQSTAPDFLRMEIGDEGPGIAPEDMNKLFSRFGKMKTKTTGGESSNGLGLSIVKKFIEAMGGSVGVQSTYGKGSTFYFELPAATSPCSRAISYDRKHSAEVMS